MENFTALELENLGFKNEGLTKEPEFHYDVWTKEVSGVWFEVTNSFETNGTFTEQTCEVNSYSLMDTVTKNDILYLLKILQPKP